MLKFGTKKIWQCASIIHQVLIDLDLPALVSQTFLYLMTSEVFFFSLFVYSRLEMISRKFNTELNLNSVECFWLPPGLWDQKKFEFGFLCDFRKVFVRIDLLWVDWTFELKLFSIKSAWEWILICFHAFLSNRSSATLCLRYVLYRELFRKTAAWIYPVPFIVCGHWPQSKQLL